MERGAVRDNSKAKDNGARLAAAILSRHGLTADQLYTHNKWMGLPDSIVNGTSKNCPLYILPHWPDFKAKAKGYIALFSGATATPQAPAPPATPSQNSTANADKTIWDFLTAKGLNTYAVAGIMGNLRAESALKPTNLQNSYETKLNMTDASYTAAVDNGHIHKHDITTMGRHIR